MSPMGGPIVIVGAGAIGGYVGAMLSLAGEETLLLDGWPDHVEAVRRDGLQIRGPDGSHEARPRIFHLAEARECGRTPARLIILSVKLYDTEWAATLASSLLAPGVPFVTLQNALVEETVARIVGWQRVLGGIATGMNVELTGPGCIRRSSARFGDAAVFKIGEMHGRVTPRATEIARLLSNVDTSVVTTNLWNDRWQKLCINAMTSGLGAIAGLSLDAVHLAPEGQAAAIRLAAEACAVGRALGFDPGPIFGLEPNRWVAAGEGDEAAAAEARHGFAAQASRVVSGFRSGMLQDVQRGRKTEVDFFNGYISARGKECHVLTPTHDRVVQIVHDIESGRRGPAMANLREIMT
jgi:2-dehydropantoate 2-reductase